MIKVSIITISFQDRDGLMRTRDSVAHQVGDFSVEHIIVDGGSRDGTVEVLEGFPDDVIWVSEPDAGRYDAMNKGIRRATGELIWFMNSGDVFGSTASVATALRCLQAKPNWSTSWGYGLARKVDTNGDHIGQFGDIPFSVSKFALGGHPIPHQAAFFGRGVIDKVGEYSLEHGLAADQLYMLQCAMFSEPLVVADFLCNFDVGGAGSSRSVRAHFRDMRRARASASFRAFRFRFFDDVVSALSEFRSTLGRLNSRMRRHRGA